MSVNLIKKREEDVKVSLKKITNEDIDCIVNFIIDRSGSMRDEYNNGNVQTTLERVFPVARVLNKNNKELNLFAFHDRAFTMPSINMDNYSDYVEKFFANIDYGNTYFVPFIKLILNKFENSKIPVFNIVITDGDHFDPDQTRDIISKSSNKKVFWKFIGVGDYNFTELKFLDKKLKGRINDNVNTITLSELPKNDSDLYDLILKEFPEFLKNFTDTDASYPFAQSLSSLENSRYTSTVNTNNIPINTCSSKYDSWLTKLIRFIKKIFDF